MALSDEMIEDRIIFVFAFYARRRIIKYRCRDIKTHSDCTIYSGAVNLCSFEIVVLLFQLEHEKQIYADTTIEQFILG